MAKVSTDVAQQLDITCRRGDTFVLDLTVTSTPAVDTTLFGGAFQVKDDQGNSIVTFFTNPSISGGSEATRTIDTGFNSSTTGLVTMNFDTDSNAATKNTIRIQGSSSIMAALTPGQYNYDFAVQYDSDNKITTYIKGSFIVNADV